ncbi:hypothetical protein FAES_2773 [Fibrella aestuarina BUZ 2]|uniref:Uncharacterized protein n=1 Tax=Fibrella aestuarina BUZ 2 TaxID=1166018 RepID=I0K9H9_9BACT|nr:hypothetical protein FAES_2773 [Fibrella aestuarina BUZ 2]
MLKAEPLARHTVQVPEFVGVSLPQIICNLTNLSLR